jgi:hypothetical protein
VIVAVYGVPGLSFAELTYFITELGIGFMAVNPKPVKVGSPTTSRVVPVVFNGAKSFIDNHKRIKFRAVAFICDSYHRLHKELNWPCVGVRELGKDKHEYTPFSSTEIGGLIQQADKLKVQTSVNLSIKVYNPSVTMIEKFSDSALAKSHTMMHRIKDQDTRARTFAIVKAWFIGDVKSKDSLYTKLKNVHVNSKYVEELLTVLTNKEGLALRRAAMEGRNKPGKIDALARKSNVTPFDIRYILSGGGKKK